MKNSPDVDAEAEHALTRALQNLPLRRAPADLETRVLHQLERRRSRDSWRRGFTHWPAAARAGFVGICISLLSATLVDYRWSTLGEGALQRAFGEALSWTYLAVGFIASAIDLLTRVARALPESWLVTIATAAAALYAVLFGLSAVAFRTLYLPPPPRQVIP
jgi:hypothetical protein